MHQDIQNESNRTTVENLEKARNELQRQADSIGLILSGTNVTAATTIHYTRRRNILNEQLLRYENLLTEYQRMVNSQPPALLVIERARPASWPDRPGLVPVLLITGFLSFLFALLLAVTLERKKSVPA